MLDFSDYRMLTSGEIERFQSQGWEEHEIAELELYMLNNTFHGLIIQNGDFLREVFRPLIEAVSNKLAPLIRKIKK